jgi:short subunit dehydrogenase-like uncharacterized protein
MSRTFDLVLYGATGFTGRLCLQRLAEAASRAPIRFAIAGRDAARLQRLADEIQSSTRIKPGILTAAADDAPALARLAAQTRVVLSTAGPFDQFGDALVAACVEHGSDYCDITGEPRFVARMVAAHHERARDRGVRIVHCCGFDSVPADLGVQFVVEHLPSDAPISIAGFISSNGTFSGGTWQSALLAMARRSPSAPRVVTEGRTIRGGTARFQRVPAINGWSAPLPTIDPLVVLRSARALPRYGPDFRYAHHARFGTLGGLVSTTATVLAVATLAQFGPTRRWLASYRPSGEGPDADARARSRFKLLLLGEGGGRSVVGTVAGGDPGYEETSKMLVQSALCLAFDEPAPRHTGVITPATAMGGLLRDRLIAEGLTFEVSV